jgi:hypothetical protein
LPAAIAMLLGSVMNSSPPRRPFRDLVRALLLALLVPLGVVSALYVVALLVAWYRGEPALTTAGAAAGAICALAALLFVFVFHFRRETLVMPVEDRRAFCRRLASQLEALGYQVSLAGEGRLVGRPGFHALLFGGAVEAQLGEHRAILTGPKVYLEVLRRRLRVHNHLEQVPHTLAAVRRRQAELKNKVAHE